MIVVKTHKSYSKFFTVLSAVFIFIFTRAQTDEKMIYILQWTSGNSMESWMFWYLKKGQESFVSRNCSFQNCFITSNRSLLDNILDFDVLLFNVVGDRNLNYMTDNMPSNRSQRQLYVFVATEPAASNPISHYYNSFFNLTWTYKFASDIFHPFFVVKNNIGEVIGPKVDVKWLDYKYFPPTNKSIIRKLLKKNIAAAWVSAICKKQPTLDFIQHLVTELSKYGHRIDNYGRCGQLTCQRNPTERLHLLTNCHRKIESDYYFYLAFENYFAEDYVTEEVLHGLQHFIVPIVLGGANYTRFLPKGSYIDALKLGVENLAKEMYDIINDPARYYNFFRWHGFYNFQDSTDYDHRETICEFCAFLNNELNREKGGHIHQDLSNWLSTISTENSLLLSPTKTTKKTTTTTTTTTATPTRINELSTEFEQIATETIFSNFFSNLLSEDE